MRHPWKMLTAGAVLLACTACAEPATAPMGERRPDPAIAGERVGLIRFAALRAGDRLEVRYASRGCFHEWEHLLAFTGEDSGDAALETRTLSSNLMPGWRFVSPTRLSAAELARLDQSIAGYRTPASTRCFTTEQVTLTLFRGARAMAHERYEDPSCSARDVPDALALRDLFDLEREP
jgi:hypothetical protein